MNNLESCNRERMGTGNLLATALPGSGYSGMTIELTIVDPIVAATGRFAEPGRASVRAGRSRLRINPARNEMRRRLEFT
jgi:hypothetical protein